MEHEARPPASLSSLRACGGKSAFDRTSAFANYKLSAFARTATMVCRFLERERGVSGEHAAWFRGGLAVADDGRCGVDVCEEICCGGWRRGARRGARGWGREEEIRARVDARPVEGRIGVTICCLARSNCPGEYGKNVNNFLKKSLGVSLYLPHPLW
jgi:hypothetical protein